MQIKRTTIWAFLIFIMLEACNRLIDCVVLISTTNISSIKTNKIDDVCKNVLHLKKKFDVGVLPALYSVVLKVVLV